MANDKQKELLKNWQRAFDMKTGRFGCVSCMPDISLFIQELLEAQRAVDASIVRDHAHLLECDQDVQDLENLILNQP